MFLKKMDSLSVISDYLLLLWTVCLCSFCSFGQSTANSYENLWKVIQTDTVSNEKKIQYLDVYYQKARTENNQLEQYRALEKKTYLVPFADAAVLLHQMHPLVQNSTNDSIKGKFLNRSTVFYYNHRYYKDALYYAIASEAFNEKINNQYNLNVVRITIGNIYHHTRHYQKAITYFTKAKEYYQTKRNYNHLRGYINALYNLNKTYWQLQDTDLLTAAIKESELAVALLNPKDQQLETAYLEYVKGGLAFLKKNNVAAKQYFEKALPVIQQNGDFTNEHVIYLYLGKIAWEENQKPEAVNYFAKIDELFHEKEFLNYELREAYEYLMAYYKETHQSQLQFQATQSLMTLNQQFEKEQQSITSILHQDLEHKKLEVNQSQLQKLLIKYSFWMSMLGGTLSMTAVYIVWKNRQRKKPETNSGNLQAESTGTKEPTHNKIVENKAIEKETNEIKEQENTSPTEIKSAKTEMISETKTEESVPQPQDKSPGTMKLSEQRLLQGLEGFEKRKEFLTNVLLDDLVKKLNTNRSTLSSFLNEHKGSFKTYINKLRIQQAVADLTADTELRKKSVNDLANLYGNLHPKTFTSLFKTETGLTLASFIEQLPLKPSEPKEEE